MSSVTMSWKLTIRIKSFVSTIRLITRILGRGSVCLFNSFGIASQLFMRK